MHNRRSEYDVTNQVNLRKPRSVYTEVSEIISDFCPDSLCEQVHQAFSDLTLLYRGRYDGYLPCDVPYHDLQHIMDVTLATARLLSSYEKAQPPSHRLGPDRIALGIILALFHDCGYIRSRKNEKAVNGAQYTKSHVFRGEQFLRHYLPRTGWNKHVEIAAKLIHFTGYEKPIENIPVNDNRDKVLGYIVGSADLFAQMADRCYLEKCRDRLYPEFVLGGMASRETANGKEELIYHSAEELLQKTPEFYRHIARPRLDEKFNGVASHIKNYFDGQNLYQEAIDRNLRHLDTMIKEGGFRYLRRQLLDTPESRAFPYQKLPA